MDTRPHRPHVWASAVMAIRPGRWEGQAVAMRLRLSSGDEDRFAPARRRSDKRSRATTVSGAVRSLSIESSG
jgi:hypothetical protein